MLHRDAAARSFRGGYARSIHFRQVRERFRAPGSAMMALGLVVRVYAVLLLAACATATYERPGPVDETALRARAESIEEEGIRVSAVIPTYEESQTLFGIDLAKKSIQPVWLEIENNTDRQIQFLPTGLDPEYFSPLEVAFGFHNEFARDARSQLDEHIESMGFRQRVDPHSGQSGFIFTNEDRQSKWVTVDLIGDKWTKSFTLVVPTPDRLVDDGYYERLEREIAKSDRVLVDDLSRLRELLENLPCCTINKQGMQSEPLNVVIIGKIDYTGAAFVRRNYRMSPVSAQYLFGRPQDVSVAKFDRWAPAQPQVMRGWLTNIRFRGQPVWIGQVSMPFGGRFAEKSESGASLPIDPDVDEARNALVADMIYSQSLVKLGFVKGVGTTKSSELRTTPGGRAYHTDGLRSVLFFGRKPLSISQIQFLEWEPLVDHYRKQLDAPGPTAGP